MARYLTYNDTEALYSDSVIDVVYPYTLHIWQYKDTNSWNEEIGLSIADKDDGYYEGIGLRQQAPGVYGHIWHYTSGAGVGLDSSTAYPFGSGGGNTWLNVVGVFAAINDRRVFLNGGDKATDTTSSAAQNTVDRYKISGSADSTPTRYAGGRVAEAAIWNVALTDAEVAILGKGYSPLFVRPESLVFYAPLFRDEDRDVIQGVSLTLEDTPDVANHPPIIYPAPTFLSFPVAAAGAYTLTADAGSYAITGTDANLEYNHHLDAASGSFAETGTDANLEYHRVVSADSGSYVWTGTAASLLYNRHLDAASGSYVWTGTDATLTYISGYSIQAEAGSYVWTGTAVDFLYDRIMVASAGTYTWTGIDVDLTYVGVGKDGGDDLVEKPSYEYEKQLLDLQPADRGASPLFEMRMRQKTEMEARDFAEAERRQNEALAAQRLEQMLQAEKAAQDKADRARAARMANLAKAQVALEAKKKKEDEINKARKKNLQKARRKLKRQRKKK